MPRKYCPTCGHIGNTNAQCATCLKDLNVGAAKNSAAARQMLIASLLPGSVYDPLTRRYTFTERAAEKLIANLK